jgi:predicted AAA+ superfamily ATPase
MWIQRDIEPFLRQNSDYVQIIRGPRQCGKSSLILKLDPDFQEVSLDDPALRELAQEDPELFLKQFTGKKLFIDEAQYAPQLFPLLKRRIDLLKRSAHTKEETLFRLSGSNQILMDRNVKESLAGRASYFDMNTLSVSEILRSLDLPIQSILYTGGWPELYRTEKNPKKYLDDYINTYVEKDVVLAAGIKKANEFLKVVRLLAGRCGELLDLSSLSIEAGVDSKTIKEWTSVLERMGIIYLLQPFSSNLSSRLTKSPKIYFLDSGLAVRLQGWTSPEAILTSPQQGHLFENLVFSEIYKFNLNHQLGWQIFHWRSRDSEEVDFLIQMNPKDFLFIEAKVSSQKLLQIDQFPEVKKVFRTKIPEVLLCHQEGERILGSQVPLALLSDKLKSFV